MGTAAAICLVASSLLSFGLSDFATRQRDASRWVDHTLEVLERAAMLDAHFATMTSEGRGYLLTHDATALDRLGAAELEAQADLASLRALTSDNSLQQGVLDELAPLVAQRITFLHSVTQRVASGDQDGVRDLLLSGRGRVLAEDINARLATFKAEERRLLNVRAKAARRATTLTIAGLVLYALVVAASVAAVAGLLISRRRARARLADLTASDARFRSLLATVDLGAFVTRGLDGTVHHWSEGCARLYGWTAADVAGRHVHDLLHTRFPVSVADVESALERDGVWTGDLRQRSRDGREVIVEARQVLHHDAGGRPVAVLEALTDVTERRRLETQVRDAHRMEAIGQVTAGVAHDFNNLLQAILGNLEMLGEGSGLGNDEREYLASAEHAARRGASLTQRLLAFTRQQALNPVLLRPEEALADVAGLLSRTLGSRIRLEVAVSAGVWPVWADASQLDLCLFNLGLNGRDAMPDGGSLWLRAENMDAAAAAAAGLPASEHVRFTVEDEGVGMTPETLARAYEPFFTTKPVGKGTGLGLSMVQGFARQTGGDVRIDSVVGHGTAVSLWLPRAAEATSEATVAEVEKGGGSGRILVVDDDAVVGRTLSLFLSRAGFAPVVVGSGDVALERLEQGCPYDLLVTDQSMPGLTGVELIEHATRLRPGLPTLLVTGYDKVRGLDRLPDWVGVLRKPIGRDALLREVRALLGGAAPAPGSCASTSPV